MAKTAPRAYVGTALTIVNCIGFALTIFSIQLLDHLQQIERAQHRERLQHWGPRTIDLDMLMFDDLQLETERLTLPHPGLHRRAFVLYPLLYIDDALEIPGHGMLSKLVKRCPQDGLQYLGTIEGYIHEPGYR